MEKHMNKILGIKTKLGYRNLQWNLLTFTTGKNTNKMFAVQKKTNIYFNKYFGLYCVT